MRITLVALLTVLGIAPLVAADPGTEPVWVPGEVVVELRPGQDVARINARYQTTSPASIPARNMHVLRLPTPEGETALLHALQADARVVWAQLNYEHIVPDGGTQSFFLASTWRDYHWQYAPRLLQLDLAQALSTGRGVVVAVLDTGASADHELLAPRLSPAGFNFVDANADVSDLGNGIDDDGDGIIDEETGHGTFVCGLVATVAPGCTILPIKVLNSDGVGTSFAIAQGLYYAIEHGARVINLSLDSSVYAFPVAEGVADAQSSGAIVVACVGNHALEHPVVYPAANPGVIAVAATDKADRKAPFSDYGTYVSLCAPGVGIVSAMPGNTYARAEGTSFACAFVSGAAALAISAAPTLPAEQISFQLASTATPIDSRNPGFSGLLGAGRIAPADLLRSLAAIGAIPQDMPPAPAPK